MTEAGERYILNIACPDTVGIVAAVSGFLAEQGLFITESHHFGDVETGRFFMRTVFHPTGPHFSLSRCRESFGQIGERFDMNWAIYDAAVPPRVLLMVSRFDHCLNDLLYRVRTGSLQMEVAAIVSNHMDLSGIARAHGIPFFHVPVTKDTKSHAEERLFDIIAETGSELVVLARYMQILSDDACGKLKGRVINIHHSFLPSFKGARPYHQAHARGVKLIGATAHFVTGNLDEGPIIAQAVTPVDHSTSAEEMVAQGRDIEAQVLARAVRAYVERRLFLNGTKTVVF